MQPMLESSTHQERCLMSSFPALPTQSHLSPAQSASLRRLLLLNKAAHRAEVDRHAAAIAASSLGSPAGNAHLDRAASALRMYVSWEAVEAIDEAFARIETGAYGSCGSCERPIPFERLEVMPEMRFCAACGKSEQTESGPRDLRALANGGR
jgi:RNA polymerase-binding transcription factor DksA